MRIRALPSDCAVIIVEGSSDRSVLLPFAENDTLILVARGKDRLIPAYDLLDRRLRAGVVFILDCDGATPDRLKGRNDLVLTVNRDLEADLVFELAVLKRVVLEILSNKLDSPSVADGVVEVLTTTATAIATSLGIVHQAALSLDVPTRVPDPVSGRRRKIIPSDLGELDEWLSDRAAVQLPDVIAATAAALGWSQPQLDAVGHEALFLAQDRCSRHQRVACESCQRMRFCNGHHLVDALTQAVRVLHSRTLSPHELDRLLRLASTSVASDSWAVLTRVREWQRGAGVRALR